MVGSPPPRAGAVVATDRLPEPSIESAIVVVVLVLAIFVGFGEHRGIARHVRWRIARAEPAAIGAHESGARRLAFAGRAAGAEQHPHRGADIAFEAGARDGKILAVIRSPELWPDPVLPFGTTYDAHHRAGFVKLPPA